MAQQTSQIAAAPSLPQVRLEVRQGSRTASYALDQVDFLIGTVPGCDLRLPGAELPPVVCLLARRPEGLSLRKLAPTQVLLLNGQTATKTELADGDRITIGALDVVVHVEAAANSAVSVGREELHKQVEEFRTQVVRFQEERQAFEQERQATLAEQKRQAGAAAQKLEQEQAEWEQRREAAQPAPGVIHDPKNCDDRVADLERQRQELAGQRQELADRRKQLYDRYQERRDRLGTHKSSVDHAARKVQERKRQVDEQSADNERRCQDMDGRQADLDSRAQELAQVLARLEEERRGWHDSQNQVRADLDDTRIDLERREAHLAQQQSSWEDRLRRYETDVLRLDRRQGELERREEDLADRGLELEEKLAKLQTDGAELEQQALELDEWKVQLEDQAQRHARQEEEHDALSQHLGQRAASLEGQQATLAALRARLERVREEVQRQEQQVAEERARQDQALGQQEVESQALLLLRSELDNEQKLRDHERQQLTQRQMTLEAAVANLRLAQDKIATDELALRDRAQELDRREQGWAEQEGVLQGRLTQVAETQERLDAERQALRERTLALAQAEQARETLQEQLRQRSEALAARHKEWQDKFSNIDTDRAALEKRRAELNAAQEQARLETDQRRRELDQQAAAMDRQEADLQTHQEALHQLRADLAQAEAALLQKQQSFAQEQESARAQVEALARERSEAEAEWQALRRQAGTLAQQLPELELRGGAALDRLSHAREQLRDHLAEVHGFVQQCQEDLDGQRRQLQTDVAQLGEQEQAIRLSQDEHRLALAAFRQQLITWQGSIGELKRTLARGETRLERKQAHVDEEARRLDEAAVQLARQTEHVHEQHQVVAQRRQDMDRHLLDMREWYRRKLRDLAGLDLAGTEAEQPSEDDDAGTAEPDDDLVPTGRNILSLTEPMSPADERLGELLRTHELVDAETLTALLVEGRRQRRSLRQVLLASGVVTLYQLALIEAGNVTGLMLGPVRVLDRLRSTPHETVYRVYDPRRSQEAVLRHLAEADAGDAVRPDEFRQRFSALLAGDPHWIATWEVLDVGGRPAVLQEWLTGLPASDWPPLAAAPGVCYRLLTQASLGLAQAHQRGLVHGRLDDASLLLTADGVVKICGLGEPAWLLGLPEARGEAAADLEALGRLAAAWCTPAGVRKGAKTKPLPATLAAVLERLTSGGTTSAPDLLADLDRAGADVPANAEAWDRLLKYVRENGAPEATLRLSA